MEHSIITTLIYLHLLCLLSFHLTSATTAYYTAGVLEFNSPGSKFTEPKEIVASNLEEYLKQIVAAKKQNVDILVFPEASLNYNDISTRSSLIDVAVELKSQLKQEIGCDYSHDNILSKLSNKIKEQQLYVLVNVVEKEKCIQDKNTNCSSNGFNMYNSNMVFNRNGCVISRYRKFNLFLEPLMNITATPEVATFDTDFGVKFGHFICFDILFNNPTLDILKQNVSHLLYPSMWFSEVPFLTSLETQQGFAYRNNIVLLSSGTNNPGQGNTGSGIFVGKHGAIDMIMTPKEMIKLIVAQVPKDVNEAPVPSTNSIIRYSPVELDALKVLSFTPSYSRGLPNMLYDDDNLVKVCKGKICCEFTLTYKKLVIPKGKIGFQYRLTVFSGLRNYANILKAGDLYCAIIPCTDQTKESCGKRFIKSDHLVPSIEFEEIKIKATVEIENDEHNYQLMPMNLDFNLLPLNTTAFNFTWQDVRKDEKTGKRYQEYTIENHQNLNQLLTFGIYGRNFNIDTNFLSSASKRFMQDMFASGSKLFSNTAVWIGFLAIVIISYTMIG